MTLFNLIAVLLTLAALFGYLNERLFRLPNSIGIMLIGLLLSLGLLAVDRLFPGPAESLKGVLESVNFDRTLLHGMLSFLLFAGALHVKLVDLAAQKWIVLMLATVGVVVSTALVALGTWALLQLLGLDIDLVYCLLFGALISPTDPIAVLGILKRLGAPKDLETIICGESLFNDGVGVVVFLVILGIATGAADPGVAGVAQLFAWEALGGAVYGLLLGLLGFTLMRSIDNYHVEVLITLAIVAGGYALATALHLSGPIAMVLAGLVCGNPGRQHAMSQQTRQRLDDFWELIDEVLNAVLFLLIGVEVLLLTLELNHVLAGLLAIPLVLGVRVIATGLPLALRAWSRSFPPHTLAMLTWGGLRGGISIALALSIPESVAARQPILTMTYIVVIFSIAVQGLTLGPLMQRLGIGATARR